jgi:hypothetical protein
MTTDQDWRFDHRLADFGAHDDEEQSFAPPPHWRRRAAATRNNLDDLAAAQNALTEAHMHRSVNEMLYGDTPESRQRTMILSLAIIVASTLYVAGVIAAGLAWGNPTAVIAAILTAGLCYVSYSLQLVNTANARWLAAAAVVASIVTGVFAGVALIW